MSPSTPHGYPYPLGTDRVADGDNIMASLAQAIDTKLGVAAGGLVNIPITAAATPASVTVTFPVGRFVAAPHAVSTPIGTASLVLRSAVDNITTASMSVRGARDSGTGVFDVYWLAVLAP